MEGRDKIIFNIVYIVKWVFFSFTAQLYNATVGYGTETHLR